MEPEQNRSALLNLQNVYPNSVSEEFIEPANI